MVWWAIVGLYFYLVGNCAQWGVVLEPALIDLMHWRHKGSHLHNNDASLVSRSAHVLCWQCALALSLSVRGPGRASPAVWLAGFAPLAACLAMTHVAVFRLTPNAAGRPSVTSYAYGLYPRANGAPIPSIGRMTGILTLYWALPARVWTCSQPLCGSTTHSPSEWRTPGSERSAAPPCLTLMGERRVRKWLPNGNAMFHSFFKELK